MIPYFPPLSIPVGDSRIDLWLILVVLGIAAGTEFARWRAIKRGLSVKVTVDCTLFMVASGFVVAHLVHVLAYNFPRFQADPKIILPWYGGYSSIGGFLGAAIAIPLFLHVWKKVPVWPYLDNLCLGFLLGWGFGRTGCFSAHDHMGNQSDFFLAVQFPERLGGTRHDLGFYEALITFSLFATLVLIDRRRQVFDGFHSAIALLVYGPMRLLMDFLRAQDLEAFQRRSDVRFLGLTPAQYGSLVLIALGVWIFLVRRGKGQMDISGEEARDFTGRKGPASGAPASAAPQDPGEAPAAGSVSGEGEDQGDDEQDDPDDEDGDREV